MAQPIKFRGKVKHDGRWVYGSLLVYGDGEHNIFAPRQHNYKLDSWNVFPETVGQSTGLVDKNGKEIYEGDIIKLVEFPDAPIYEVKWSNESLAFCVESLPYAPAYNDWGTPVGSNLLWALENASDIEIIGNLYDNPELLKGGKSC